MTRKELLIIHLEGIKKALRSRPFQCIAKPLRKANNDLYREIRYHETIEKVNKCNDKEKANRYTNLRPKTNVSQL